MEKIVLDGAMDYIIWGNLADDYRWAPGLADKAAPAYRRAIELTEEAVNVNPRDATAWSSMALYTAKLGQTKQALPLVDKALSLTRDDDTVLFDAAVVCELAGERARALTYLQGAVIGGHSPHEIATEPELRKLREDPRYQAAVSPKHGH
jgi:serine/threonine-protein kinase